MKKPNFFLIGANKCGTTSMHDYLGQHPQIFMSAYKEPFHFCEEFDYHRNYSDLDKYESLFEAAGEHHIIVGESSARYLSTPLSARRIHEYNPDAKLLAMLRDPMTMVPSYHNQMIRSADEDERDFAKAWALEPERRQGRSLPSFCKRPEVLFYSECAKYAEQLERYYDLFSKEQIKVILFEDFISSPLTVYKDVLGYLGVDDSFQAEITKHNPKQEVKFLRLNVFTERPPRWAVDVAMGLKSILGLKQLNILDRLKRLNRQEIDKSDPLPDTVKLQIAEAYAEDILKLERLINRDLSHWLKVG